MRACAIVLSDGAPPQTRQKALLVSYVSSNFVIAASLFQRFSARLNGNLSFGSLPAKNDCHEGSRFWTPPQPNFFIQGSSSYHRSSLRSCRTPYLYPFCLVRRGIRRVSIQFGATRFKKLLCLPQHIACVGAITDPRRYHTSTS